MDFLSEYLRGWLEDTTQELDLKYSEIKEWPKELIGKEHLIIKLECSESKLKSLPKDLINLRILKCWDSPIVILPEDLYSLEYLDCSRCRLVSLPNNLTKLKELYCYGCGLTSLPQNLTSLKILKCQNNKIKKVPDEMLNLIDLDCRNSNIETLPDLPKLEKLEMFSYDGYLDASEVSKCYLSLFQKMMKKALQIKKLEFENTKLRDEIIHLRYRPKGPEFKKLQKRNLGKMKK